VRHQNPEAALDTDRLGAGRFSFSAGADDHLVQTGFKLHGYANQRPVGEGIHLEERDLFSQELTPYHVGGLRENRFHRQSSALAYRIWQGVTADYPRVGRS